MRPELNFEAESFGGYNPAEGEEPEEFMRGSGLGSWGGGRWGGGGWGHGGWGGAGSGFWRSRWPYRWGYYRRWPWLYGGGWGAGDYSQGSQSIARAQGCLSQITGNMIPQSGRLDAATRNAIGMFQAQQQLPATGMLDDATMSALQNACGQAGAQEWEAPPGRRSRRWPWLQTGSGFGEE
jgi:hypothetical protein